MVAEVEVEEVVVAVEVEEEGSTRQEYIDNDLQIIFPHQKSVTTDFVVVLLEN